MIKPTRNKTDAVVKHKNSTTSLFGETTKTYGVVEEIPETKYTPFDFINAIHYSKENLIVDDWTEKQYNSYIINKGLSYGPDTVIPANEMNSRPHLDKKLQNSFLINIIRPKKRFNKWIKPEKIDAIEVVKEYYGYSTDKARQILPLLDNDKIEIIKTRLIKGGRNNG